MASVGISGLYKSFEGHVAAVSDLSLEIPDGEFLVLVGPSGCGKTTTLRMVAGLELPTAGRIRIGDRDVTDLPPQERDVAMVFQSYALYPHMTVAENLGFGLRMRKVPKRDVDRRIRDVAEALGLRELLARKPAALSGGQRQRVALGRAIVREPQLFLFDEPLSNLDAKLRVHTRAELIRLHRQLGATMMYVTHDQVEAMTMGERIAVLNAGVLQQVAPPLELYDRPANLFVAGFIGSPPMNFFAGMLTQNGNAMRFAGRGIDIACADARTRAGDAVLGVRPEHCELTSIESGDVAIGVRVVEPLGSETLVHGRTEAGEDVVVRSLERPDLTPDARVGVRFDRARMHLFDAASGDRLERI